jgi:Domain of Unknown Function (DUF1080)
MKIAAATSRPVVVMLALVSIAMLLNEARVRVQSDGAPQGAPPQGPPGAGRGGGLGNGATPVAYNDYTGFTKLFDGQTLAGWNGESDVWSIDNGAIHANTVKTPGQHHLHYTGPNAVMRDFDLKVEFRISATGANGGIQYRSRLLMAPHKGSIENPLGASMPQGITTFAAAVQAGIAERAPARGNAPAAAPSTNPTQGFQNPWQVSGYQFDLDSENRYTGGLYEGQGRGIINLPGGIAMLFPDRRLQRFGTATATPAAAVKPHLGVEGEWQQVEIIARGNTLVHVLNGQVITVSIDEDAASRAPQGILSLQLEGSGQIWYRNVYVRHLLQ